MRTTFVAAAYATVLLGAWPGGVRADVLPPQIVHEPCEEFRPGQDFVIIARFYDDSPIFDPKVIYRSPSGAGWKNASFLKQPGTDDFKAVIPARNLRSTLEYFIEAFDEYGNGPARYGSPEAPVQLTASNAAELCEQVADMGDSTSTAGSSLTTPAGPDEPGLKDLTAKKEEPPTTCGREDAPLYCSPILWTVVGAVLVAGAVTASYFLFMRSSDPPRQRREKVDLAITAPDPTTAGLTLWSWR